MNARSVSDSHPHPVGGVAWGAHIGGFVAGLVLIPLFKQRDVRLFHPANR